MSISEGLRLGVELSRGARRESRADAEHQAAMKQRQEDSAYQARMRPVLEQQAQLGLRDLEGRIAHGEKLRPLEVEQAGLGLTEAKAQQAHNAQVRPLEIEQAGVGLTEAKAQQAYNAQVRPLELEGAKERITASKTARQQQETMLAKQQEQADIDQRRQWVAQQAPLEYARFQRTGQFSDRFLRDSMAVGSPVAPLRLVDGEHIDALDTLQDLLDPRKPSNPYEGDRLFKAANLLLAPELNNGGTNPKTGAAITDKKIVAVYPATDRGGKPLPGQLYVELEVTDENGDTYRAPATVGRGSGDDEELKTISLDKLVHRVNAQQTFAQALGADPTARQRLVEQGKQMTQKPDSMKSDEISWQGRARKFADVYKVYNDDASLKTAEGAPLVSFEDFEWTSGDPEKLSFLRAAAQENERIYSQAMQLQRKKPQEAARLLQEWVDPRELYTMATNTSGADVQARAKQVVGNIGNDSNKPTRQQKREAEQQAQAAFTEQPDWYLEKDIPSFARQQMNSEQWQKRKAHEDAKKAEQSSELQQQQAQVMQQLESTYPTLSEQEKRAWILKNGRYLDRDTRRNLLTETQPERG